MKDRILINKNMIPYSYNIMLWDNLYEIEINYNKTEDLFTIALYKDNLCICFGEPIIYGVPLFKDIYNYGFPSVTIIPYDESEINNKVTYDNFNETVFLCIDDEGD